MKTTFFIREKSAERFFINAGLVSERDRSNLIGIISRDHMVENIYVPKNTFPEGTASVMFELSDRSSKYEVPINVHFEYVVTAYDDISVCLQRVSKGADALM